MPRMSKYKFREDKFKELQEHFSYLISSLSKSSETESFFDEFLTGEEKVMLTKRLVLILMLKKNYPTSAIIDTLHISPETVRLHQNQLPYKSNVFHETLERLISREKAKEFFKKLEHILKPLDTALRLKNDMKARAKFASGSNDY